MNKELREVKKALSSLEGKIKSANKKIEVMQKDLEVAKETYENTVKDYRLFIKSDVISMELYHNFLHVMDVNQAVVETKQIELGDLKMLKESFLRQKTIYEQAVKELEKEKEKWGKVIKFPPR